MRGIERGWGRGLPVFVSPLLEGVRLLSEGPLEHCLGHKNRPGKAGVFRCTSGGPKTDPEQRV